MNDAISAQTINPYCPDGYRLPNQRELTLMNITLPEFLVRYTFYTYLFFHGEIKRWEYKDKTNRTGYGYSRGNIFLDSDNNITTTVRCVGMYTARISHQGIFDPYSKEVRQMDIRKVVKFKPTQGWINENRTPDSRGSGEKFKLGFADFPIHNGILTISRMI